MKIFTYGIGRCYWLIAWIFLKSGLLCGKAFGKVTELSRSNVDYSHIEGKYQVGAYDTHCDDTVDSFAKYSCFGHNTMFSDWKHDKKNYIDTLCNVLLHHSNCQEVLKELSETDVLWTPFLNGDLLKKRDRKNDSARVMNNISSVVLCIYDMAYDMYMQWKKDFSYLKSEPGYEDIGYAFLGFEFLGPKRAKVFFEMAITILRQLGVISDESYPGIMHDCMSYYENNHTLAMVGINTEDSLRNLISNSFGIDPNCMTEYALWQQILNNASDGVRENIVRMKPIQQFLTL